MEKSCLTWLQLIEFTHAVGLYFVCQAYEDLKRISFSKNLKI